MLNSVKLSTHLALLLSAIAVASGLGGCFAASSKQNLVLPCQVKEAKDSQTNQVNPKISLAIDGSLSMLGYVKTPNSRYIQTLGLLDTILLSQPGGVNYFRLESDLKSIPRSGIIEAQKPDFYQSNNSPIAKAFEASNKSAKDTKEDGDRLVAVVTDLQPDSGDVNLIGKQILDRYLKKEGYAVAIWGIRSEFEGKVYPPDKAPVYDYSTKGKGTDKGRPFYVLIAGPEGAIANLEKELKTQGASLFQDNAQFTLFSPSYSIDKVAYAQELKETPPGYSTPTTIKAEDGTIIEDGEQPVRFLEVSDRAESKTIEFEFDRGSKLPSSVKIDPNMNLQLYDVENKKFVDAQDRAGIKLDSANQDRLSLALNPEELKSGTYYLNIDLQTAGMETPPDWDKWNDNTGKDGAKTQGLNNFMRSISTNVSVVSKNKQSTAARLCLAIHKQ